MTKEFLTTPTILLRLAQAAGSRIEFSRSARALEKETKKRSVAKAARTCRILSAPSDTVKAKYKDDRYGFGEERRACLDIARTYANKRANAGVRAFAVRPLAVDGIWTGHITE